MKEGWRNKRIDEITYLITDGDWIESRHQSDDGFRLIQTGNIGRGIFKSKDDKPHFISETTFKELSCTEIFEGDCLISRLPDPVGRSCLIPNIGNRMITAVDCTILRFKKEIMPPFFVYYTQSNRYSKEIEGNVTGATRKRISRKNLEKIQVPIPPLSEQQRIVEELDLLSSIIEKKKAQIKELDNLAQSLFYEMFGDPISNEKGWEIGKISNFINVKGGFAFKSQRYTTKGIRLVQIANVWKDSLSWDDITYISEEDAKTNSSFLLKQGDIVMAMTRPIIQSLEAVKVAIVNEHDIPCILNQRVCKFEIRDSIDNIWLYQFLRLPYFKYKIKEFSSKGMQPNVSSREIESIQIFVPPFSLQQQFASKIEVIEHQKELIKQSIKEVETLFNSRMDYYFN